MRYETYKVVCRATCNKHAKESPCYAKFQSSTLCTYHKALILCEVGPFELLNAVCPSPLPPFQVCALLINSLVLPTASCVSLSNSQFQVPTIASSMTAFLMSHCSGSHGQDVLSFDDNAAWLGCSIGDVFFPWKDISLFHSILPQSCFWFLPLRLPEAMASTCGMQSRISIYLSLKSVQCKFVYFISYML